MLLRKRPFSIETPPGYCRSTASPDIASSIMKAIWTVKTWQHQAALQNKHGRPGQQEFTADSHRGVATLPVAEGALDAGTGTARQRAGLASSLTCRVT